MLASHFCFGKREALTQALTLNVPVFWHDFVEKTVGCRLTRHCQGQWWSPPSLILGSLSLQPATMLRRLCTQGRHSSCKPRCLAEAHSSHQCRLAASECPRTLSSQGAVPEQCLGRVSSTVEPTAVGCHLTAAKPNCSRVPPVQCMTALWAVSSNIVVGCVLQQFCGPHAVTLLSAACSHIPVSCVQQRAVLGGSCEARARGPATGTGALDAPADHL